MSMDFYDGAMTWVDGSDENPHPVAPYPEPDGEGKTSGWSGSEASHERALDRDASGKTGALQKKVLFAVAVSGGEGITIKELRETIPDEHHGNLSGALSNLHKAGLVARLTQKRDRCSVYTLNKYVQGREVAAYGSRRTKVDQDPTPDLPVVQIRLRPGDSLIGFFQSTAIVNALREHGRIILEVE